jgi:hypothetical protein
MSPIGRVFAVLNVGFAFMFLYHAGVYMQRDAFWKQKYTTLESTSEDEIKALEASNTSLQDAASQSELQKETLERRVAVLNEQITELTRERDRLSQSNTNFEAQLQGMEASLRSINSTLEENTRKTEDWQQKFMAAESTKDDALAAQSGAENELRQAQNTISQLQNRLSERDSSIEQLTAQVQTQTLKLEALQRKAPGLVIDTPPPMFGSVVRVDAEGRLLTIVVSDKPDGVDIEPGHQFAIYKGATYKGEATVTGVDGNFAFCRMTSRVAGQNPAADDQATSKF